MSLAGCSVGIAVEDSISGRESLVELTKGDMTIDPLDEGRV